MDPPNWSPSHRQSLPQYSSNFGGYSTPYSGNNGRATSLGDLQHYQQFSYPSRYSPGPGAQHVTSSGFHNSPQRRWQNGFDYSQQTRQQQGASASIINATELNEFASSAHQEPWTGVGSVNGYRPQQGLQAWSPVYQAQKAHTVAGGGAFSPIFQPSQLYTPTRTSVPSLIDSAIASSNTSSQVFSKFGHSNYDYASSELNYLDGVPPATPMSVKSEPQAGEEGRRRRKPKTFIPPCVCGKELKNQSDKRKHQLQHEKPHRCEWPSCSRSQGFATKNDLQRHRKSVHGAVPLVGKPTGYICRACAEANPGAQQKWWPRQDNFKAHIERKHKDIDMTQLLKRSEAPRPENAITESGYGGSQPAASVLSEGQAYQQDMMSPLEMSMSRQCSNQDELTLFGAAGSHLDTLAGSQFADTFDGPRGSISHQYIISLGVANDGMSMLHSAATLQLGSPIDSSITSPAVYQARVPEIRVDSADFLDSKTSFNQMHLNKPFQKRQKSESTMKAVNSVDPHDNLHANRTESGEYACEYCEKTKKRECDLRKHIKRHTRPYGCTFPNCYKRFGSRNDWKRHENSQHFLQEMWRCGLKTANNETCGKLMYNAETFVNHLQKRHSLDSTAIEDEGYTKTMHLGREGHKNFFCGFCNALKPQPDSNQQDSLQQSAWVLRAKHIGDHFDKDNCHIDDWVCIEHNKRKGLITKEDRKKAKTRFQASKAAEDSDLPDDGIPSKQSTLGDSVDYHYDSIDTKLTAAMGVQQGTNNKRKVEEVVDDDDADGVSDCD